MRPKYLCFTKDHDLEKAMQAFRDRYHLEPKEHKIDHGILWVGPIPGQDAFHFDPEGPRQTVVVDLPDQNGDQMQLIMF
jgi:hypothetical protein